MEQRLVVAEERLRIEAEAGELPWRPVAERELNRSPRPDGALPQQDPEREVLPVVLTDELVPAHLRHQLAVAHVVDEIGVAVADEWPPQLRLDGSGKVRS